MLLRNTLIFAGLVSAATLYPAFQRQGWFDAATPQAEQPAKVTIAKVETQAPGPLTRTIRISGDARGHYTSSFSINGRKIDAMIDTGASVVAINRTIARRLGIAISPGDFTRQVNTANGTTRAAPVVFSRIEIGRIQVRDVEGVVLDDDALNGALIGMSFLKSLRFTVEDNTFVLKQ